MPRTDLVLALSLAGVTLLSRLPFRARLLPTWDAVQFALALEEYDIVRHQPHPPGYILYVGAARAIRALVGDPTESLTWLSIVASAVTIFLVYRLTWGLYDRATALVAAVTLAVSPLFWLHGVVGLSYAAEAALATLVATLVWPMALGQARYAGWSALALGLAGGVRQSLLVLLFPLWLGMAGAGLRRWRPVLSGGAVIALTTAAWLVPMVWLSGGLEPYVRAALELYDSTVRATTILDAAGGWRANVRGLIEACVMGVGLLLPVLVWVIARGLPRAPRWGVRGWFFAGWIVPPLVVYTCVHFGQYGYLLTVLPAFCILIARWVVVTVMGHGAGGGVPAWRAALTVAFVAGIVLAHTVFFARAEPVDVPELPATASRLERWTADLRAYYRFRVWRSTVPGLREQESVIAGYVATIRRDFDARDTVLVTEVGNPRSYPWFRHVRYYLPEFTVYHLRLGRFSPGYLSSRHGESMAALAGPTIDLPPNARRLVWVVDSWNPAVRPPPGLRERLLPYGRKLYALDLSGGAAEHGGYRLTPRRAEVQPGGAGCAGSVPAVHVVTFHGDPRRLGWNAAEADLAPARVARHGLRPLWSSPRLDSVILDGRAYAPHLYATPLYVDNVRITAGPHGGRSLSVVFAASSNGWVYAVSAFARECGVTVTPPGTVLWQTRVGTPAVAPGLDGGVPIGVLSTPVIDLSAQPPRMYVAAMDASAGWRVLALDVGSGHILPGWPLTIDEGTLAPITQNGPARFGLAPEMSQRGALNLGPRGDVLYVAFGTFRGVGAGWMVAVDTRQPRLAGAFAAAPGPGGASSGGMWGSGGPAVDADGQVYMTTGNSPGDTGERPGVWGNSLLRWSPPLRLSGTYTPFNYCVLDRRDMDLGGSSPLILPDLDTSATSTPRLLAFGGKQGTLYLLDRARLPGGLDRRPPCATDSWRDRSLLPPGSQPQFGARGPLSVFGPYTDEHAQLDRARMRTTPAYHRDAAGSSYLFVTGSTKAAPDSAIRVPPGLVRLRVVTEPGVPAYLAVDRREMQTPLVNPGAPIVTSKGSSDAVVWVLDANMPRLAPLVGPSVSRPVLYAFDATTLTRLWQSGPEDLEVGGKYSSPVVAHGVVFVGTDRIQAFGLRPPVAARAAGRSRKGERVDGER